jgi:hypothetical protein
MRPSQPIFFDTDNVHFKEQAMQEAWIHQLEQWREFYLLIGTAGVTLTGLLFVVISIGPKMIAIHESTGVRAFISPNAVYFTSVLVVSGVLMAPEISQNVVGWLLCVGAVLSLVYLASVRAHRQWQENRLPVLDWIWFIGLPILAYLLALLSGVGLLRADPRAMYGIGTMLVLLLVIGIRNAWDLVIWIPQQEHKQTNQAGTR